MKDILILISTILLLQVNQSKAQGVFLAIGGTSTFFSETKMENIDAASNSVTSVLNTANGDIGFTVPMRSYKFKRSLMEEHFNEKYVESDKYPNAIFKGKINETIDWTKDGVYNISSTGIMSLHGVDKAITEKGKATIKDAKITIDANFLVKLTDYKIDVPSLVMDNIAPVIKVTINCNYSPYKKAEK